MKSSIMSCKPLSAAIVAIGLLMSALYANAAPPTQPTIPTEADQEAIFEAIERDYHFSDATTPLRLQDFLSDFPSSIYKSDARRLLADWYFYNADYPTALKYYASISDDAFSGNVREEFLYRKAFTLVKTGYYNEAASYFRKLATSKKYGADAQFYTAYIHYVNGRYDEAYTIFSEVRNKATNGAEADYYLMQIDYKKGYYRKVANAAERLLTGNKMVPEELKPEAIRVGALSFFKLGDKTTARKMLREYVDLINDGAEISALYTLATIYYDEGEYDRALDLFSIVTEYPGDLAQSSWLYIGQIYLNKREVQAATLAFDKAARESWSSDVTETSAYNLAVASAAGSSLPFADATAAMEQFIDTYPTSPYSKTLSSYLANAYYGKRDYENALRQVDKITPKDAEALIMRQKILYQLGVTLLQRGEIAAAIRALSEACLAGAPDPEVRAQAALWLGDAYYACKEYSKAAAAYENAISSNLLEENTGIAQYNLGYTYLKLHSYAKAEKAFKEAMRSNLINPVQMADSRLRYADCLYYTGKYGEAMTLFRDIKTSGGSDAVFAAIREADILGKDGRVGEKISILEGLTVSPDVGVWLPTVYSRLADAYSEQGNDRKAAVIYSRLLDSSNKGIDNSQVYYSLATNAENLYNAGDMESAYTAYHRLEQSGIPDLYPSAIIGIMRTSTGKVEIAEYAAKVAALPGLSAEDMDEALYRGAEASLALDAASQARAMSTLRNLAASSDRLWGARAGVTLGETLLKNGNLDEAEKVLQQLIDEGSEDNYWLARGYIALADVYNAQDKDYLARLYLETLRSNYPGKEKDIKDMINTRLKALD